MERWEWVTREGRVLKCFKINIATLAGLTALSLRGQIGSLGSFIERDAFSALETTKCRPWHISTPAETASVSLIKG